ncbi:MAG: cytochrome c [Bacteroidia bacterium]|jgi:mono/diheme cytochrome c family protein|nr:cytochrome c [Bacteroidia bacterium]
MKKLIYSFIALLAVAAISACSAGGDNPGVEYAPNMYVSFAYEPLSQLANDDNVNGNNTINPNGLNMREPVKGSIARGQLEYAEYNLPKSNENYEASSAWRNPLPANEYHLAEGKRLYNINCTPCHAEDGKGEGTIVLDKKYPRVPAYSDRLPTINAGKAFYSITHGKNLMGAYGSVLTPTQRWQVIHYIYQLSGVTPAATASTK